MPNKRYKLVDRDGHEELCELGRSIDTRENNLLPPLAPEAVPCPLRAPRKPRRNHQHRDLRVLNHG